MPIDLLPRKITIRIFDPRTNTTVEEDTDYEALRGVTMAHGQNGINALALKLNNQLNKNCDVKVDLQEILTSKPNNADEIRLTDKTSFRVIDNTLIVGDKEERLTTKASGIMRILCDNLGEVITYESMVKAVWGEYNYFHKRSYDVYIAKLRKALLPDHQIVIMNVHGVGTKVIIK